MAPAGYAGQRATVWRTTADRCRRWKASAGQVLETLYALRLDDAYERLAYHYARTDNVAKAVVYLTHVGEKAARHSAHVEAITHFIKGLELLQTLPATPERSQQELRLHIALGASLIATKGYAAPEVAQIYTRARQLCQHLEDPQQLAHRVGPVLRDGTVIRLGLRLAVSGSRETVVRLVILAAAVGVGVGLLLTVVSAVNAVGVQNDRYACAQAEAASCVCGISRSASHGEAVA